MPNFLPQGRARRIVWLDLLSIAFITGLAFIYFRSTVFTSDYLNEDVAYIEQALSIKSLGFYGFNGIPETVMPPGYPLILAVACATIGCTHVIALQQLVVTLALGLLVTYLFLRNEYGSIQASMVCCLFMSSPLVFHWGTRLIGPDIPYFLTTMLALSFVSMWEFTEARWNKVITAILFALALAVSLIIRTAALAMLSGLVGWIVSPLVVNSKTAIRRCKAFAVPLLVGLAVQVCWTFHSGSAPSSVGISSAEWPMTGFPGSYISQVGLKSANYPELGPASLLDHAATIESNALSHAALLEHVLFRRRFEPEWSAIGIAIVFLVLLGLGNSIYDTGGRLHDWYFLSYEAMYLLWPWSMEQRFLLPVAPLACMYGIQGCKTAFYLAKDRPRTFGLCCLPLSTFFALHLALKAREGEIHGHILVFSGGFWLLLMMASASMLLRLPLLSVLSEIFHNSIGRFRRRKVLFLHAVATGAIAMLIRTGTAELLIAGHENRSASLPSPMKEDIEAAEWIESHTPETAIILARHVPIAFHYSKRHVIWFPPISNPEFLINGIRKYKVRYVVVVQRKDSYYLPSESDCFELLSAAYPQALSLVYQSSHFKIFSPVEQPAISVPNST